MSRRAGFEDEFVVSDEREPGESMEGGGGKGWEGDGGEKGARALRHQYLAGIPASYNLPESHPPPPAIPPKRMSPQQGATGEPLS